MTHTEKTAAALTRLASMKIEIRNDTMNANGDTYIRYTATDRALDSKPVTAAAAYAAMYGRVSY